MLNLTIKLLTWEISWWGEATATYNDRPGNELVQPSHNNQNAELGDQTINQENKPVQLDEDSGDEIIQTDNPNPGN